MIFEYKIPTFHKKKRDKKKRDKKKDKKTKKDIK